MSWKNDRYEHSLASRGIKTKVPEIDIKENDNNNVTTYCPFCPNGYSGDWETASAWLNLHLEEQHKQKLIEYIIKNGLDYTSSMDESLRIENVPLNIRKERLNKDVMNWGGYCAAKILWEENTEIKD